MSAGEHLNGVQFSHQFWERSSKGVTSRGLAVDAHHPKYGRVGEMSLDPDPDEHGHREIFDVGSVLQRQGVATGMINYAREAGLNPRHSSWRTDAGDAWARKVGGDLPERETRMSASDHLSPDQFNWRPTTDRHGKRAEVANTEHGGYVVDGNGAGRMKWTVQYPDNDYGMTDSKREARAWAAGDRADRASRKRP